MNAKSNHYCIRFGALPLMACLLTGPAAGDGLGTYRDDYGTYTPLGDAVTADMKFHAERLSQQRASETEVPEDVGVSGGHIDAGPPQQQSAGRAAVATPSLESLTDDSNYSVFMQPGVSAELRRQALRRLFRSQKFAAVDHFGTDWADYREFLPLGDVITADMRFHAERQMGGVAQVAATYAAGTD
jgi:hypothetical protein